MTTPSDADLLELIAGLRAVAGTQEFAADEAIIDKAADALTELQSLRAAMRSVEEAPARDVLAERERQKSVEGWTPEHDDQHAEGELGLAAACYAIPDPMGQTKEVPGHYYNANSRYADDFDDWRPGAPVTVPAQWPWDGLWWKPTDRRRDLVKAGALILAEIERLDRATPSTLPTEGTER